MNENPPLRPRRRLRWLLAVVLVGLAVVGIPRIGWPQRLNGSVRAERLSVEDLGLGQAEWVPVRRSSFDVTIRAGGDLDTLRKTEIENEAEAVGVRTRGSMAGTDGRLTILSLVPDGSFVEKGQILCTLDSSEYQDLYQSEALNVERARAELVESNLRVEVAEASKQEYLQGTAKVSREQLLGRLALSESDQVRARDRLEWSRRMLERGYVSRAQVVSEELGLARLAFEHRKIKTAIRLFEDFTVPKMMVSFDSQILSWKAEHNSNTQRLKIREERLANLVKQIERCTIRAPHEGMVVYATDDDGDPPIHEGMRVHTRQDLFILPDFTQLVVLTKLHETVVNRVKAGMPSRVRIEAFPGDVFEGEVHSIDEFPVQDEQMRFGAQIKRYLAKIRLARTDRETRLRPGMTAEVEIFADQCPDALVIPPSALVVNEDGKTTSCYVVEGEEVEIRDIELGKRSADWVEVLDGLDEGDSVLANSSALAEEQSQLLLASRRALVTPDVEPEPDYPTEPADLDVEGEGETVTSR